MNTEGKIPLQKVRVCSQDFLEQKDHNCAKRCFPKEIMKCFLCTTAGAENTFPFMKSFKRSLLSFPCVPTAFLTLLTTLQFSDFKAGFVVALLKVSIWKHVQLWGWEWWIRCFAESWLWRWNQAAKLGWMLCFVCRIPGVPSWSTSKGPVVWRWSPSRRNRAEWKLSPWSILVFRFSEQFEIIVKIFGEFSKLCVMQNEELRV